jgi:hypothetical protein
MPSTASRRELLQNSIAWGSAALLGIPLLAGSEEPKKSADKEPEVTATEDLMREHGVLRRALLVFQEVVPKLRQNAASVDAAAIRQAAQVFRTFGEDITNACWRSSTSFR